MEPDEGADLIDEDFLDLEDVELRVGSRVRHSKFGVGVVHAIDGGHDPSVTVKFSGWGVKRIKQRFLLPA